jgi:methyl-accepting chemotaxis protein
MRFLKKMTLSTRLVVMAGLIATLLLMTGVLGVASLHRTEELLQATYRVRMTALEALAEIQRLQMDSHIHMLEALNPDTKKDDRMAALDRVDKNSVDINARWLPYRKTLTDPQEEKLAGVFSSAREVYGINSVLPIVAALRQDLIDEAIMRGEFVQKNYKPVSSAIKELVQYQIAVTKQNYEEATQANAWSQVAMIVFVIGGLFVSVIAAAVTIWTIKKALARAVVASLQVANGNLAGKILVDTDDELGQLLQAMETMRTKLNGTVMNVRNSAEAVAGAANEIADGNSSLSEEQASTLEETAATMEEVTSTVKQNAMHAGEASEIIEATQMRVQRGAQVIKDTVEAMSHIETSSNRISEIIGVINGISFQTNLLALNAAVESARAGENGRGFAVVASEVRNLSHRSASAAKEISQLISDSVTRVKAGSQLVSESDKILKEMLEEVGNVARIVAEIAAASREQASGVEQINNAVVQMDQATQQNSALVEEIAAASTSMQGQANTLAELVRQFRVGETTDTQDDTARVGDGVSPAANPSTAPAPSEGLGASRFRLSKFGGRRDRKLSSA